jgi:hypothetical protein
MGKGPEETFLQDHTEVARAEEETLNIRGHGEVISHL